MNKDKHYSTDDGNGMKVVGVIILASMLAFMTGMLVAYKLVIRTCIRHLVPLRHGAIPGSDELQWRYC